ncbi:uncharacterized [Tachysurus ichikawai]
MRVCQALKVQHCSDLPFVMVRFETNPSINGGVDLQFHLEENPMEINKLPVTVSEISMYDLTPPRDWKHAVIYEHVSFICVGILVETRNGQDPIPRAAPSKSEWPQGQAIFKYPSHSAIMKKLLIIMLRLCVDNRRRGPVGERVVSVQDEAVKEDVYELLGN